MSPRLRIARLALPGLLVGLLGACASNGGLRAQATPASAEPVPVAATAAPVDGATSNAPAATPETAASAGPAATTPTQAEDDFAAIYGAGTTTTPGARNPVDPWERFNRRVHHFNNGVDRTIAKPLARAYIKVTPPTVRLGIGNFFNNLGQPVSALNALLQGRPKQAGQSIARFTVNLTAGLLGFLDPATSIGLPNRSEDFGQTLARWGWKRSRYLELPLLGPRTMRDAIGAAVESPLSPLQQIEEDRVRVFLQGLQLVDLRTNLLAADSLRQGAYDDYTLTRDAWLQRRNYQIDTNNSDADAALPNYLDGDSGDGDAPTQPPQPAPQPAH